MSDLFDIESLRQRYLQEDFAEQTFLPDAAKLAAFATACGELASRYTDPADSDFQAAPTFPSSLQPKQRLPEGFPKLPGLGMDTGKSVIPMQPIRPGVRLTARIHLHDIYRKTGRSGHMTFFVTRMEFYDPQGVQVASADTSTVIREKPTVEDAS